MTAYIHYLGKIIEPFQLSTRTSSIAICFIMIKLIEMALKNG